MMYPFALRLGLPFPAIVPGWPRFRAATGDSFSVSL